MVSLDVEIYPNMPRNWSKAVHKGNGPVPQQEEFGSDQFTLAEVCQADVPSDTKIHKRIEDAVAVQAKHMDSCSANQVDPDPMCLTSFRDNSTEPPALACSRDVFLVDNGAAVSKLCLSPLEMRTPTAAGVLLPTGTSSVMRRTAFDQPPLWFCSTDEINLRTPNQYVMNYNRFWKMKALQINRSMQTLMFNPGGFKGRRRACPLLET